MASGPLSPPRAWRTTDRVKETISDIYPKELTISETTESNSVDSYLDLGFTRNENNITTKLYDQGDAFGFHIVKFPFMSSNIPSAPAYGVYASQLIRYAHCCSNYSGLLSRHRGPGDKAFVAALQSYRAGKKYSIKTSHTGVNNMLILVQPCNRLSNTFKKFYGRHTDLVGQYKKCLSNVC